MDKEILIFLAITLAMLIGGGIIIQHLIKNEIAECTSNPLPYAVKLYEGLYGKETYGYMYIGRDRYFFNSTIVKSRPLY